MTVHKSKGLKFNCVIVPYCGQNVQARPSLMELSPDGKWAIRVLSTESEEKVAPLMHYELKEARAVRELAESTRVFLRCHYSGR